MQNKIIAVIVTYQPDADVLSYLLKAVSSQVDEIIIVDNGSITDIASLDVTQAKADHISVHSLGKNMGVAFAQNRGVEFARERQAQFVLLMDQDSIPAPDMVSMLLEAKHNLVKSGQKVAAVGPRYIDPRQNNPPPFIRIKGFKLERCACLTSDTIVPVDYLISSGCLIPLSVLDHVGGMKEDYFIDYVDIEWGLRVQRFGYQCYGVCGAYMSHCLGNEPLKFFNKLIPLHDPLRHYYHFRNAVLLSKEPWVPVNWKMVNIWRLCLKYFFYSFFTKQRLKHWQMMTLGILHGLSGKTGQYGKG